MNKLINFFLVFVTLASCKIQKLTLERIYQDERQTIDFPMDYCLLLPPLDFEKWDNHFLPFDKLLSKAIVRTQMKFTFTKDSVYISSCFPSASPWVQLDTLAMIKDDKLIIGDWRILCCRKIIFEDSVTYPKNKIYRSSKEIFNDKENDMYLSVTDKKFKLYNKTKNKTNFKQISAKNYCINNKRFMMIYGFSKAGAAINFIGIDIDGRLILDSFYEEERIYEKKYAIFHTTMTQYIFKKI